MWKTVWFGALTLFCLVSGVINWRHGHKLAAITFGVLAAFSYGLLMAWLDYLTARRK